MRGRCDGDEGLTWQVLWGWSGVSFWIGDEEFLRKVRLLTLRTRLSCHVSIHILHHRQKYSQILARMSDVHENAIATRV